MSCYSIDRISQKKHKETGNSGCHWEAVMETLGDKMESRLTSHWIYFFNLLILSHMKLSVKNSHNIS